MDSILLTLVLKKRPGAFFRLAHRHTHKLTDTNERPTHATATSGVNN